MITDIVNLIEGPNYFTQVVKWIQVASYNSAVTDKLWAVITTRLTDQLVLTNTQAYKPGVQRC